MGRSRTHKTPAVSQSTPAIVIPRLMPIDALRPNPWNLRTHSKKQIGQVEASIANFGFAGAVVADEDNMVLAGHARLEAARRAGLKEVPVATLSGLSPARKRVFMLADNKIANNAGYDREGLAVELPELAELLSAEGLEIALTGFEPVEIDQLVSDFEEPRSN